MHLESVTFEKNSSLGHQSSLGLKWENKTYKLKGLIQHKLKHRKAQKLILLWSLDIKNLYNEVLSVTNNFFTPVKGKCMEKYLDITKPYYSEQFLPVSWHVTISRFRCISEV